MSWSSHCSKTNQTKIEQQTTTRLPGQRPPPHPLPPHTVHTSPVGDRAPPSLCPVHFRSHVYALLVPPSPGGALPLRFALLHHGGRGAAAEVDPVSGDARPALLLLSRQARSRPA